MEPVAILGVAAASAGLVAVLAGLRPPAQPVLDATSYIESLDLTPAEADEFAQLLHEPMARRILRPFARALAGLVNRLLPSQRREQTQQKLHMAGKAGELRADELITAQLLLLLVGVIAGLAFGLATGASASQRLAYLLVLPTVGFLFPTVWLNRAVEERRGAILKDLPDTLDLLAISAEAGVGFEGALAVVCERFDSPLATEFSRTLQEMGLGLPRREALQNLKRRTEVPELSNFVLALTQADALGMPIGRVLKLQATEMRNKRRQWAREKAGKLPVKIMFPLVLFIFPPVFVIVLGPAFVQIGQSL